MKRKRRPQPRRSLKKPKFLSLRLQFPPEETTQSETGDGNAAPDLRDFPVPAEEQADDTEAEKNVALLFSEGDTGATSLNGLLDGSAVESNSSQANSNASRVGDFSPASYKEERAALVRTAMRSRDRDFRREKWVSYSEVVERKVKEEEVSSSAVDLQRRQAAGSGKATKGPLLKLDYDEIMNAWSNKGPLYIYSECSQIVPDINNDFFSHETSTISGVGWGGNVGHWTVPEMVGNNEMGDTTRKSREETMGQREASVLRYREKRQSRLFSKKIRYQVRKLNAEKRPRLKGRFVKKS